MSIQSFGAVLQNSLGRFKTKNNCWFLVSIASLSLAEKPKTYARQKLSESHAKRSKKHLRPENQTIDETALIVHR